MHEGDYNEEYKHFQANKLFFFYFRAMRISIDTFIKAEKFCIKKIFQIKHKVC